MGQFAAAKRGNILIVNGGSTGKTNFQTTLDISIMFGGGERTFLQ
jgi:hypothetical protein